MSSASDLQGLNFESCVWRAVSTSRGSPGPIQPVCAQKWPTARFILFQSPVLSCCFAKFHPNLVIGGTYSGRIALWDNRANRRTPVQRSPLSAQAHTVRIIYKWQSLQIKPLGWRPQCCHKALQPRNIAQLTLKA